MNKKVTILLIINFVFAFLFIFVIPELLSEYVVQVLGIGISIILIEIPICLSIIKDNKD